MTAALSVLQVIASVAPGDGGPSVVALSLNQALRERGVVSRLLTTDADGLGRLTPPVLAQVAHEGGPGVEWHRAHAPRQLKTSFPLALAIRRYLAQADVVHIHGHYLFHCAAAAALARQSGVPYVIQPHGVFESYQRQTSMRTKAVYDKAVGRRVLDHASGFLFTDQTEAAEAFPVTRGVPSFVVPLGAALDPPPAKAPAWWSNDLDGRMIVAFIGRIAQKKRIDLIIDAMPRLLAARPSAHLLIAGPFDGSLAAQLRSRAEQSPARERITFLGDVRGADKTFLLDRATTFALPSENENFAISVAEALLAGCPVVVSNHVAVSARVTAAGAGVVITELTAEAVAQALIEVSGRGRADYRAGTRAAAQDLTWSHCAELAEVAYRAVLATA